MKEPVKLSHTQSKTASQSKRQQGTMRPRLTLVKSGTRRHVKEVQLDTDRADRNDEYAPDICLFAWETKKGYLLYILYLAGESRMVWRRGGRRK